MKIKVKQESKMVGVMVNGTTSSYTMSKVIRDMMTPEQKAQYEFTQKQFDRIKK